MVAQETLRTCAKKSIIKVIIWWCYRRKHLIGKFSPDTSASYSEQSTTIYYKYHDFLKLGHSQFGQKSISSMISPLQSRVADPAGAEPDPYFKKLSNSNMVLPSEIKLMYCPTYDRVSKDQLHWLLFLQRTNLDPGHFSRVVSGSAFSPRPNPVFSWNSIRMLSGLETGSGTSRYSRLQQGVSKVGRILWTCCNITEKKLGRLILQ